MKRFEVCDPHSQINHKVESFFFSLGEAYMQMHGRKFIEHDT